MGLIDSAVTAARLYLWRRRQFENRQLRAFFSRRYGIEVGLYSYGCFDRWRLPPPLTVGRYCSFASTVRRAPSNHPLDAITTHPAIYDRSFGVVDHDSAHDLPLVVSDDVWIGHNVMILPGCGSIGRGAVIGASSVVTRDVPAYAVMVGNPARKLRDRFSPDLVAALELSRWWELDLSGLRRIVQAPGDIVFHPEPAAVEAWVRAGRP